MREFLHDLLAVERKGIDARAGALFGGHDALVATLEAGRGREAGALSASLAAGMVVFLQRLVQGDTSATAVDRFAATVIGVVIAFAVLGVVQVIGRQRRAAG